MSNEQQKSKPFHEWAVEMIDGVKKPQSGPLDDATKREMYTIAKFICGTRIPAGHGAITAAWAAKREELGLVEDLGVSLHVLSELAATKSVEAEEEDQDPDAKAAVERAKEMHGSNGGNGRASAS